MKGDGLNFNLGGGLECRRELSAITSLSTAFHVSCFRFVR